jgi:hypothetical protein
MIKLTIRELLTRDLGFCCPWAGLTANRKISSDMLGTRLGVSGRSVRYQWDKVVSGETKCEHRKDCMKQILERRTENARARKKM